MSAVEFKAWGKTPRMFRDVVVTEKIDGSNAAVIVAPIADSLPSDGIFTPYEGRPAGWHYAERWLSKGSTALVEIDGVGYFVGAQSRNRLITPGDDNFGFAGWVAEHAETLVSLLGPGHHFGEWWGSGIQRGYGLTKGEKHFSLFNTHRHAGIAEASDGLLDVVPEIYSGPFSTEVVSNALIALTNGGSWASPGFMQPEGVVVFHTASRQVYKALIESDHLPKGLIA